MESDEAVESDFSSEIQSDFDQLENEDLHEIKGNTDIVPHELVNIPKGDKSVIDKLVSYRISNGIEQVLAKYKNMAYCHCDWIDRLELEKQKNMAARIRKFLDKPLWETQYSDEEPFNPAFLKVFLCNLD